MTFEPARSPVHHVALHNANKRLRTNELIRRAVNDGKPLPLQVMLETMWRYRDEALRYEHPPGHPNHDPTLARQYRMAAVAVAEKAAPYVHPKLQNVSIRPEDEDEAEQRRASSRLTTDLLKGKSVKELGELWLAIAKGDEGELAELVAPASVEVTSNPPDTPDEAQPDVADLKETPP